MVLSVKVYVVTDEPTMPQTLVYCRREQKRLNSGITQKSRISASAILLAVLHVGHIMVLKILSLGFRSHDAPKERPDDLQYGILFVKLI